MLKRSLCLVGGLAMATGSVSAQIYADVKTTKGTFTMQLYYQTAPRAVANFIRLAEGSSYWLDPSNGLLKKEPYYNGLKFHRVLQGVVSQAGARVDEPTDDGPGYTFRDEMGIPGAVDRFWLVYMDNIGPNTNRARFFMTASSAPVTYSAHTLFAQVNNDPQASDPYASRKVCYDINQVAVDDEWKPVDDVIIEEVSIRRVGASAQAFDEHGQDLPQMAPLAFSLLDPKGDASLEMEMPPGSLTRLSYSGDLNDWQQEPSRLLSGASEAESAWDVSSLIGDASNMFFHVSQVKFPANSVYWPDQLKGRDMQIATNVVPEVSGQIGTSTVYRFSSESGGTAYNAVGAGAFNVKVQSRHWLGSAMEFETPYSCIYNGKVHTMKYRLHLGVDSMSLSNYSGRIRGSLVLFRGGEERASFGVTGTLSITST
ncbi:peptidylprolyl isomerase [Verrucomicrobiaceae bacterium N1E253]|uniref:peptidylprolyl isomerase n=1 Tax=Oceaniferula marina TaxID=2748318 RepID=A0A851GL07_9BACT|nr:peptidylprolyl isomerase [Oceaniferula marina]NWK56521.1 peptidylprolyl isomerase [Oceaniferula marina]